MSLIVITSTSVQNMECNPGYTERSLYLLTLLLDVYRFLKQIIRLVKDATISESALLAWAAMLIA